MRTPDKPVNVLVVTAVVDVALSLLCPLPVAACGPQPLCRLARRRCLRGSGMRSALLDVITAAALHAAATAANAATNVALLRCRHRR